MPAKRTVTKKNTTSTTEVSEKPSNASGRATKRMEKTVNCAPAPALNVRKAPSRDSEIVAEYKNGTSIECESNQNGWCKTKDGYVMADYLV